MKKITGTYDIVGETSNKIRKLEDELYKIANLYNYEYIKTPIIEKSSLYHRDKNNTPDIVNKNTYDFKDLSGEEITLRPEINSGIARAVTENKLYNGNPLKYYYYGDVFRYDKPQKNRYREFTQFGFEIIGNNDIKSDAEIISLAHNIYKYLKVYDIELRINSIGSIEDIMLYRRQLIDYFTRYKEEMCNDCKNRLITNPLRILDCKDKHDKEIINNAPLISNIISKESKERFDKLQELLQYREIPFTIDEHFIRGIDYQNDTIFEIISHDKNLGSNNELSGGGRYNNLYNHLFNKDVPAIGFDFGLERLLTVINSQNPSFFEKNKLDVYFICISEEDTIYCSKICDFLRENGIKVDYSLKNCSYKKQLKNGDKYNPKFTAFIGEKERKTGIIDIRNNEDNTRQELNPIDIISLVSTNKTERNKVKEYGSK